MGKLEMWRKTSTSFSPPPRNKYPSLVVLVSQKQGELWFSNYIILYKQHRKYSLHLAAACSSLFCLSSHKALHSNLQDDFGYLNGSWAPLKIWFQLYVLNSFEDPDHIVWQTYPLIPNRNFGTTRDFTRKIHSEFCTAPTDRYSKFISFESSSLYSQISYIPELVL